MAIFKGAGVAIVTPMYEDGKVNYDKLEELLEFQIANSTDAIIICGTTGESSTMTHGEHLKTIKFAIDERIELEFSKMNCAECTQQIHLRFEILQGKEIIQTMPGFGALAINLNEKYTANWFV